MLKFSDEYKHKTKDIEEGRYTKWHAYADTLRERILNNRDLDIEVCYPAKRIRKPDLVVPLEDRRRKVAAVQQREQSQEAKREESQEENREQKQD